jgi:prevent-host-death family protein
MRTIAAGEFKAKCLAVMVEVDSSNEPVLVTKRGKPLVRVIPVRAEAAQQGPARILGRLRHLGRIAGDVVSSEFTNDEWDRMFEEKWVRFEQGSPE